YCPITAAPPLHSRFLQLKSQTLIYQADMPSFPLYTLHTSSCLAQVMGENPDFALMFVAPMDAEGVKLISRASYEMVAGATGSPF
ncbi:hypothetical protein MJI69_31065, partial [Salmonella enterica subsp. enterica serovar Anatum]|nr:hypothetical protein [Salmonella enterica subsp. enterica serovar Anatum]